jgi:murein DD-endopeptidase MepM/ murein hydrolase activator NlpD
MFRERQIYVRSKGQVQFVTLRPYMQVIGLFILLTGFFWIAFASINVTFKDELIAVKERNLYQSRLDSEERIAELRKTIDRLNEKLMLDQRGYLQEVDKVRREYQTLVGRQERLQDFFRQGWLPLRRIDNQSTSVPKSNGSGGKQDFSPVQKRKNGFNEQSFEQKYARPFSVRKKALAPLKDLRLEMAGLESKQAQLLDEVIAYAEKQRRRTRKIYSRLGVNATAVLKLARAKSSNSTGGPFVAIDKNLLGSRRVADRMKKAADLLNQSKMLNKQSKQLPLAMPVSNIIRFTSRFGLRRDPLRKVAAMHTGIDIKAPYASRLVATADGTITFAGWAGGYGRLIKIQHSNGIVTRYGHMLKLLVKTGQHVKRGQPIGLLGSSGRSTGPHVHYETRVNGKAINPARFWKARNDFQTLSKKR